MPIVILNLKLIRSKLCDYNDVYIHVKATIRVPNTATAAAPVDSAQDIDIVMPVYNLIEYSDIYSKTSGSLWQYYRDESALANNNYITDFPVNNNNSISFKFKQQITGHTENGGTKNVAIMVPLIYLSIY